MLGRMSRRIVSESKIRQLMKGSWAWTGDNDVVNLRRLSILSYPITCPGSRSRPAASPGRAVSFSDWDGQDLQRLLGMAHVVPRLQRRVRLGGRLRLGRGLRARSRLRVGPHALAQRMLEGLLYLLLLLLVLFLILLFIFLFLFCASRLSTRRSKVDKPPGQKETALDFCIRAVSFWLSFVLWLSLCFFRKAAGRSSRRWISVSSLDWLCSRPAGPVNPDSTF